MTDSGRQIKTPADAVPHEAYVEITPESGHPSTEYRKFFTAAEVAQIACSYGHAIRVAARASEMKDKKGRYDRLFMKAIRFALDYEAKFLEWGKQT